MSDIDGVDPCTQVLTIRHAWGLWPCPVVPGSKSRHFPRPQHVVKIYVILEAPGWSDWMPEPIVGRGGRQAGQTGGKIPPTNIYCNEEERWCGLLLGSVLFRLVAPPLQL
jgi:hypothetical protein